ncbi:MAG: hypothetical protein HZA12_03325 [Nitrospirae bacterium]|nr:hypothetical protein [Nitrospirota bacterium]
MFIHVYRGYTKWECLILFIRSFTAGWGGHSVPSPVVRQGLRPPQGVIGRGRRGVAEEKIRPRQPQYPVLCQAFARTRNQEKGQEEHSRQASGEHGEHGPVE